MSITTPSEIALCKCGCGLPAPIAPDTRARLGQVKGQPLAFRRGHYQRTVPRKRGYPQGQRPQHTGQPVADKHVLIAEAVLGRRLPKGAEVHHVDGNRQNHSHSNLVICQDRAYHHLLHVRARVVKAHGNPDTHKICGACRSLKPFQDFQRCTADKATGRQGLCRVCRKAHDAERWKAKAERSKSDEMRMA